MHIELKVDKSILILPLKSVAPRVSNPLSYLFHTY